MRLIIEIVAAVLLIICVSVSSAAFAAGPAEAPTGWLLVQRGQGRFPRRALRLHQAPMRRKVLRELLRRQAGVGGEVTLHYTSLIPGEVRDP